MDFLPQLLGFGFGLICVDSLFVLPFYSLFFLAFVLLYVVFDPFHNHNPIEIAFRFDRFIRVVLKLNALPDTVQLEHLESFVHKIGLFLSESGCEFGFLLFLETIKFLIHFDPIHFYLLSL